MNRFNNCALMYNLSINLFCSLVIQKDEEIKLKDDQIRKLSDSKREMEQRSAHELHMKDKEIKRCIKKKMKNSNN